MTVSSSREEISRSIEAFTRSQDHVKYAFGSKDCETGGVDCSGFIFAATRQLASEGLLDTRIPTLLNASSEAQIANIKAQGGTVLEGRGNEMLPKLKAGMVIGIDNGQKGFDAGRAMGIDHVVTTYTDQKTGELMIAQSSSDGKGVNALKASDWLQKNANDQMYAIDLVEANGFQNLNSVAAANLTPTREDKGQKTNTTHYAQLPQEQQGLMTLFMVLAMLFGDNKDLNGLFSGILGVSETEFTTFRDNAKTNGWTPKEAARRFDQYDNVNFERAQQLTTGFNGSLISVIQKHESNGGDYNIANGGSNPVNVKDGRKLTEWSIAEVLDFQKSHKNGDGMPGATSSAMGAWQMMPNTLESAVKQMHLDPNTTKFDKATQDKIALHLMVEKRGLDDFLTGKISKQEMMSALAHEWASMPTNFNGDAAYGGKAGNPYKVPLQRVRDFSDALDQAKETYQKTGDMMAAIQATSDSPNNIKIDPNRNKEGDSKTLADASEKFNKDFKTASADTPKDIPAVALKNEPKITALTA